MGSVVFTRGEPGAGAGGGEGRTTGCDRALDAPGGRVENRPQHVEPGALLLEARGPPWGRGPPRPGGARRRLRGDGGRPAVGVHRAPCAPRRLPAVSRRHPARGAALGAAPEDLRGAGLSPGPRSDSPARPRPGRHGRLFDLPPPAQLGGISPRRRPGAAPLRGMPRPALHVPGGVGPELRLPDLPRAARRRPELPPAGRCERARGAARRKVSPRLSAGPGEPSRCRR